MSLSSYSKLCTHCCVLFLSEWNLYIFLACRVKDEMASQFLKKYDRPQFNIAPMELATQNFAPHSLSQKLIIFWTGRDHLLNSLVIRDNDSEDSVGADCIDRYKDEVCRGDGASMLINEWASSGITSQLHPGRITNLSNTANIYRLKLMKVIAKNKYCVRWYFLYNPISKSYGLFKRESNTVKVLTLDALLISLKTERL